MMCRKHLNWPTGYSCIDKGKIVQQGTPDQLLFEPSGDYARNFFEEQRFQLEAGRIGAADYPALIRAFDHFRKRQH
jgi:ABC-type proline/glycine betaine transport system ATPase subunit